MKRLSSFDFVTVPQSSPDSQHASTGKRMRCSAVTETSVEQGQVEQEPAGLSSTSSMVLPPDCGPDDGSQESRSFVRNDIGTYSRLDVQRMSDDDRLWLLHNAFRPEGTYKYQQREGKNMERNVPFKVLGCMNFLGCAFQNLVMAVIAYFVLFLLNIAYPLGSWLLLQ